MKKINFNEYNKGLRYYATLFNLNPTVFATDLFIDISIDKDFLILQYKTYPKYYIIKKILENEFFYNDIVENNIINYRFKLKTNDQKADFSIMQTNGTEFCTKEFILSMAILWKDYLDSSFYDTIFQDYITQKRRQAFVKSLPLIFSVSCNLSIVISTLTWNII